MITLVDAFCEERHINRKQVTGRNLEVLPVKFKSGEVLAIPGSKSKYQHIHLLTEDCVIKISCVSKLVAFSLKLESELLLWILDSNSISSVLFLKAARSGKNVTLIAQIQQTPCPEAYHKEFFWKMYTVLDDGFKTAVEAANQAMASIESGIPVDKKVVDFLRSIGFKNINEKSVQGEKHYLVIAVIDEEAMDQSTRTFPIRLEISDRFLTLRLFFSRNNSVVNFESTSEEALEHIIAKLNACMDSTHYIYDSKKRQINLVARFLHEGTSIAEFGGVIDAYYHEAIAQYKWTSIAFFKHYTDQRLAADMVLNDVLYRNPAAPTEPPFYKEFKSPAEYYQYKEIIRNLSSVPELQTLIAEGSIGFDEKRLKLIIRKPLNLLSLPDLAKCNLPSFGVFWSRIMSLVGEQEVLTKLREEMIYVTKDLNSVTVIPKTNFATEKSQLQIEMLDLALGISSQKTVSNLAHLDYINFLLSSDSLEKVSQVSESTFVGMFGLTKVRCLLCPEAFYQDLALSSYHLETQRCDLISANYGLIDLRQAEFENRLFLVHEFTTGFSDVTFPKLKLLGKKLLSMHAMKLAHGFLSKEAIDLQRSPKLILPCFYPVYFHLVSSISLSNFDEDIDLSLLSLLRTSRTPSLTDLMAADVYGFCRLLYEFCRRELEEKGLVSLVQTGLEIDPLVRPKLSKVMEVLE